MNTRSGFESLFNGRAIELESIPLQPIEAFEESLVSAVDEGLRVSALFAVPAASGMRSQIVAVLADDSENRLYVGSAGGCEQGFPSLARRCPQVQLFEREIAEQTGWRAHGHPWFHPVRFHHSWTGNDAWNRAPGPILPGVYDFYRVAGEEVHEVAVGPVHAGIIEPGHFRFQCHGEEAFHLEISLGYQHRGIEKALLGGPNSKSLHFCETLAGDTTVAHTTSYCQILEALAKVQKSPRAQTLRGIALELERIANHVGDLGALAGDVGYLPTASFCGRLRGDFLNMTATLCGNRFGRGFIRPGGVGFDVEGAMIGDLLTRLTAAEADTRNAVELLWDTPSVMARLEGTGPVPTAVARELGLVGPAARASGLRRDVRHDQPSGIFRFIHIPVSTYETGDVFARAHIRWYEIQQSIDFIREQLQSLPSGDIRVPLTNLAPRCLAVSLNEGWRGEVCHVALTDGEGRFARYKIVDPSFHNWSGLAYALRNQQIADFPICNKSFNMSYCGHDL